MSTGRYTRQALDAAARSQMNIKPEGAPKGNYVAVARGQDLVVFRVVGRGNMLNAPALQEFADEQIKAGFTQFLFDFERCTGLDSTFMGAMVGLHGVSEEAGLSNEEKPADESGDLIPMTPEEAMAMLSGAGQPAAAQKKPKHASVSAVNVSKELLTLLGMLGVDAFVKMRGSCDLSKLETALLPEKAMTPQERSAMIYEAHKTLIDADKRNEAQFGDLLRTLAKELGK